MTTKAIEINELVKYYGKFQALKGVTLDVDQGEIFGFLGPNGAGKTTTIRCMLDMIRPQDGSIQVLGLNPQKNPVDVRQRVGYLPGELNFEGNMRVSKALRYFAELRGNQIDWDYVLELANRMDLDLEFMVKNLSKGNKQKVGVVQALMHKPDLLILDEPTSGLDPLMQQDVYRLLRAARDGGATIFFSSHIINEVETLADRVAIIRNGVIIEEAEPQELKTMEMRRIRVQFSEPQTEVTLANMTGVNGMTRERRDLFTFQVEGDVDEFIKSLGTYQVIDIDVERPSLEEIFLAYYAGKEDH
ncbi:MAG: ABC transporter ATP-binding protein [Anaerolineales bacterium]